jgi:hypothetical protein
MSSIPNIYLYMSKKALTEGEKPFSYIPGLKNSKPFSKGNRIWVSNSQSDLGKVRTFYRIARIDSAGIHAFEEETEVRSERQLADESYTRAIMDVSRATGHAPNTLADIVNRALASARIEKPKVTIEVKKCDNAEKLESCAVRESNPRQFVGNELFYHYTNGA